MSRPDLTIARELEAALAWWHAAGVDCDYVDDATAWLAEAPAAKPAVDAKAAGSPRAGSGQLFVHPCAAAGGTDTVGRGDFRPG